jgi:hypothetical protein
MIAETTVMIPQQGRHRLKIAMVDPGVVLDKIEIIFGKNENLPSYFGAPETKFKSEEEK